MNVKTHREPLRILWLIKGLGRGGAETILETALERFDQDAVKIDVGYVLPHKNALVPRLREMRVTVFCLSEDGKRRWPASLRRLIRKNDYDVIHTHSPLVAVAARMLISPAQVVVHTEHDVWDQYVLPTRVANAVTMRRNRRVFTVSQAVQRSVHKSWMRLLAPADRTEVLYHGVDLARTLRGAKVRQQARGALGLGHDEPAIVMIANMTERKNHVLLLEALRLLWAEGERMRLFLVGTGPLDAELRSRVRQLGLTDSVVFLGTRQDAREILPAFDALVLPSRNEGLGLVLVEALAAGVPVVATHVGGIPEVLGGFDGAILVPPNDAHLLASALRDVVSDPTFSEKAYAFGLAHVSRFDIDHAVQRMTDVYHHVVGRTQGGDG